MVKIDINKDLVEVAVNHSKERIKFEYNRFGLSYEQRIDMIVIGCIGELVFKKYLEERGVAFEQEFQAGKYDRFDFKINEKIVEIKTSGYLIDPVQERLNLLYNKDQYENLNRENYSYCIQIFISGFDRLNKKFVKENCREAFIAGYLEFKDISGFPCTTSTYTPAYRVPLKYLKDISQLFWLTTTLLNSFMIYF